MLIILCGLHFLLGHVATGDEVIQLKGEARAVLFHGRNIYHGSHDAIQTIFSCFLMLERSCIDMLLEGIFCNKITLQRVLL